MGRDPCCNPHTPLITEFQSTLPAWGETKRTRDNNTRIWYFNPLSPHGERPGGAGGGGNGGTQFQSTLPAWGETVLFFTVFVNPPISIHSPRMGRDRMSAYTGSMHIVFQSTLPAWGETQQVTEILQQQFISIHSPRMGRDNCLFSLPSCLIVFQSTLPAWGETLW